MKRALLLLLVLLGLGLLALRRWAQTPVAADVPELPSPATVSEPPSRAQPLEHGSELAAGSRELVPPEVTLHATPGLEDPQLYGWLRSAETGRLAGRARIVVLFEDWSRGEPSAAEAHASAPAEEREERLQYLRCNVQLDGGWYVDLPPKCWVREVIAESNEDAPLRVGQHADVAVASFVERGVPVERALESGALEVSFAVERGIVVEGCVSDEDGITPVEGAWVLLLGIEGTTPAARSGRDGRFRMQGIPPARIPAGANELEFEVERERFENATVRARWMPGQLALGPLEVRLRRKIP